jgi:hypothetical protein
MAVLPAAISSWIAAYGVSRHHPVGVNHPVRVRTTHPRRARRLGARPWLVLTRQAYAGTLRDRGRRDDLRRAKVFEAATRAVAAELGMELPGWGRATLGPRD